MRKVFLIVTFLLFGVSAGHCQVLDPASKDLLAKSLEEKKSQLAADPNNLKAAEEFVMGCAVLEKWDDLLPVYRQISSRMSEREKQTIDLAILLFRTKQTVKFSVEKDEASKSMPYAATGTMRLLKNNPMEGVPEEARKMIMEYFARGARLFQEGRIAEAKNEYEKSLALKETPFPCLFIGSSLHALGNPAEAIGYLEKGIRLAGEENVTPYLWLVLANAYVNNGAPQKAISLLEDCVKRDPGDVFLLYQLADFYFKNHEDGKYLHVCEKIKAADSIIFSLMESTCVNKADLKGN
ncbi:MAG: Tetratricopeptide repeat protein [Smithella sp. PtaU1.Bin162]|nr:MAG: Tetratricopeptide repeat protein [Smithella sp. PtaU1.Bin162]